MNHTEIYPFLGQTHYDKNGDSYLDANEAPTSALPITHISYCPLYSLIYLLLFLYFLIDTKLLDIPSFPIQHTQIPQPQLTPTPTHGSHFPTKHKYPDLFHSHSSVPVSQTAPFHPTDD